MKGGYGRGSPAQVEHRADARRYYDLCLATRAVEAHRHHGRLGKVSVDHLLFGRSEPGGDRAADRAGRPGFGRLGDRAFGLQTGCLSNAGERVSRHLAISVDRVTHGSGSKSVTSN